MLRNLLRIKPVMASTKAGFGSKRSTGCPNIAVILAGCGVNDGSEIHEAVSVLSHLHRSGASIKCFAPDIKQMHVIDHYTGKEEDECRSVMSESARISRGDIAPITELTCKVKEFHAVIVPGGFGAAKNLSDFAVMGTDMSVQDEVAGALLAFHKAKKYIGFCCIAPILAAKLIPGVTITLGSKGEGWPFSDAIEAAEKLGAKTTQKKVNEVAYDPVNKVYSTPAFMYGAAKYHEVDDGIGNMVKEIVDNFETVVE